MKLGRARRQARRPVRSSVNPNDYFAFGGGLNQVDPPLRIEPGYVIASKNYEPGIRGGYTRIDGYERFDGRTKPSEAVYYTLPFERARVDHGTPVPIVFPPSFPPFLTGVNSGAISNLVDIIDDVIPAPEVAWDNYLKHSEDFTQAADWVPSSGAALTTVTSNAAVAPNGTTTADQLTNTNNGLFPTLRQASGITSADPDKYYQLSMYVKNVDVTRTLFQVDAGIPGTSTGSLMSWGENGSITELIQRDNLPTEYFSQSFDSLSNGWFRVSFVFKLTAASAGSQLYYHLICDYTDQNTGSIYAWGAQLVEVDTLEVQKRYSKTDSNYYGNGTGVYILRDKTDDWVANESISIGGSFVAVTTAADSENNAPVDSDFYLDYATNFARDIISKPTGEGSVLGVAYFGSAAISFVNNIGGAEVNVFKSSSNTGWDQLFLNHTIDFDTGTVEILEGDTMTGASSFASATVERVIVQSGTWNGAASVGGSDAAGYIVLGLDRVGNFTNGENLQVSGTQAVAASDSSAQTLAPDGRYQFREHNFFGHTKSVSLYGVSGTHEAFEYSEDAEGGDYVFTLIRTGMEDDKPTHIGVHKSHLFLSFPGGSIQNSGVGRPLEWTVVTGANELALGDECTGFIEEIGETLFIYTRNQTHYLTGTSVADFRLDLYSPETGGIKWTSQRIGQGIVLDDRGFTSLAATDRYGNYAANSFSTLCQPLVSALRSIGATASVISRRKNLYRCFFSDGRYLAIGVQGTKITGIMECQLDVVANCAWSGEDETGKEIILIGATNGFVYEMDAGVSFDGEEFECYLRTPYHHSRQPARLKRYRRGQLDVVSDRRSTLRISSSFSYGSPNVPGQPQKNVALTGGGGLWDVNNWDQFTWNSGTVSDASFKIDASGKNISLFVYSKSKEQFPHTVHGVTYHVSQRRMDRSWTSDLAPTEVAGSVVSGARDSSRTSSGSESSRGFDIGFDGGFG